MNTNRSSPTNGLPAGTDDDSEVVRILDGYLSGIEAGQPADPDKLLADHPALVGQLRAYLELMKLAGRMAEDSDARPEPAGSGMMTTLNFGCEPRPNIHLLELSDEHEPLVMPRSPEMPDTGGGSVGRYQLQGEIARGGMGAILRGRDVDLGRDLAIKVLLESHQRDPQVVRRFVEEAQIGGQLQHPGIVPVYELGTFPDRRPFFAMKLVKGRTLAALLAERNERVGRRSPFDGAQGRPDPALPLTEGLPSLHNDLPRFLAIFEQICQTIAYAHARGVIHRDLKPSNVMVGAFGEVQVMDWGLAKVLSQGRIADEVASRPVPESVITTVRSGSAGSGSESQAGSVLGTPAYMAPEQARGEVDRIDERADVFGLGAILCEILTGHPPFVGSTRDEIRAQAARGVMADSLARLEASGAEIELVALARTCLAAHVDRRPRNAGIVVERVTSYLAGVQERLRSAELARVEALARAEEEMKRRALSDDLAHEARARAEEAHARAQIERSRRRLTLALAVSVLAIAGLTGGGWTYFARQQRDRAAWVDRELSETESLYAEAKRAGDDLARWFAARDAAHAVDRRLADVRNEATRRRVTTLVRDVNQATTAAENEQKLLAKLIDIRSSSADDPDGTVADVSYEEAFREAGWDMAALPPAEVGAKIQARPIAVRSLLGATLDYWASMRRVRRRRRGRCAAAHRRGPHGRPRPLA